MQVRRRFIIAASYLALYALLDLLGELAWAAGGAWRDAANEFWEYPWAYLNALAGIVLAYELLLMRRKMHNMDARLKASTAAISATLDDYARNWALSAAEKEVFILILKGCSHSEIANIRDTAEGTVKAQAAQVYRKSGYGNKSQLLSALVEDLTGGNSVVHGIDTG
ncbi:LuxR C-terminal-related transcriptional regulator [Ruegeria sp. ANG-R]|uniref:helix-turn-helix transcriptional regulator n=1 Tax=Ruegeria sp. ANG-R TaxID=1577903 RepID=UPI00068B519A|nr:LuxR C-terminal-related transcriptional regulator [Ruegeria sp. ANG-R]